MSTSELKPIMLRARISDEEWAQIRKMAIDEGLHNSDLVGELIRTGLAYRETSPPSGGGPPPRVPATP